MTTSLSEWNGRAASLLVRHEALLALLEDIRCLDELEALTTSVATRCKYIANIGACRLVIADDDAWLVMDGARGTGSTTVCLTLEDWDRYHWNTRRPVSLTVTDTVETYAPPAHLRGRGMCQILVQPFERAGKMAALLTVASRHRPLDGLDERFIRLFVNYLIDRVLDIRLRARAMAVLVNRAERDALTGLFNRGSIIGHLTAQYALAQRMNQPLSITLLDIDRFKSINDTWGHPTGDVVLQTVADRLSSALRAGDRLGRYGGEEFIVVSYPCEADGAMILTERMRTAVSDRPIFIGTESETALTVTLSGGAVTTNGTDGASIKSLIQHADDALYRAKAEGRNRVLSASA